jgi:hypothetical protein
LKRLLFSFSDNLMMKVINVFDKTAMIKYSIHSLPQLLYL